MNALLQPLPLLPQKVHCSDCDGVGGFGGDVDGGYLDTCETCWGVGYWYACGNFPCAGQIEARDAECADPLTVCIVCESKKEAA